MTAAAQRRGLDLAPDGIDVDVHDSDATAGHGH